MVDTLVNEAVPENIIVTCLGWGDTGKATIVDYLNGDIVVRFNGGDNAGHTVWLDGKKYIFHILPTGALRNKTVAIGPDVAFNPKTFFEDWAMVENTRGTPITSEVWIDPRAHVILPYHKALDGAREAKAKGKKVGTTGRGIGPTYMDKANRTTDFTIDDLVADDFKERLKNNIERKKDELFEYGILNPKITLDKMYFSILTDAVKAGLVKDWVTKTAFDDHYFKKEKDEAIEAYVEKIYNEYKPFADRLRPWVRDVPLELNRAIKDKKKVVIESAQGTLLDVVFGTRPWVTSSNTTVGGVQANLGVSPRKFQRIIGVIKAYQSRVGEGPFPTEIGDPVVTSKGFQGETMSNEDWKAYEAGDINALAKFLRIKFDEYGSTTGRPRRIGYLDLVATKYSVSINDVTEFAITNLDKLAGTKMKLCVAYEKDGKIIKHMPSNLEGVNAVYSDKVYDFTNSDFSEARKKEILEKGWDALDGVSKEYITDIVKFLGRPVSIVSIGKESESKLEKDVYEKTSQFISDWRRVYNQACKLAVAYRLARQPVDFVANIPVQSQN